MSGFAPLSRVERTSSARDLKPPPNAHSEFGPWTHSILTAARSIYQRAGFKLIATKAHSEFGPRLVGETWELEL